MPDLSRRQFIVLSTAACATAACGSLCSSEAFAADAGKQVDVGELASFAKDGVTDTFAKSDRVLVVRSGDKVYALTARCTHKGGLVRLGKDGQLTCPNHGAGFDIDGNATKGPATDPLNRLGISVNEQGHVIVDTSKRFTKADDAGAWVKAGK
jgi:nitrite reductase/ring-hydroxylating ferredoxin subunit